MDVIVRIIRCCNIISLHSLFLCRLYHDEIDKENNRIVLDAEGVFLTFDLSRSIMKVITPAPTTETAETTEKTIIEEESAIESADEN